MILTDKNFQKTVTAFIKNYSKNINKRKYYYLMAIIHPILKLLKSSEKLNVAPFGHNS